MAVHNLIIRPTPSSCHPEKPIYALGLCRSCYEKELRLRNPEFAERQRQNQRNWVTNHKEQKRAVDKAYRAKMDPEISRARSMYSAHGITPDNYEYMLRLQDGVCAICGLAPKKCRLHIDHNHKTGEIRGLLCFRCNFGLTFFNENPVLFEKVKGYLTEEKPWKFVQTP